MSNPSLQQYISSVTNRYFNEFDTQYRSDLSIDILKSISTLVIYLDLETRSFIRGNRLSNLCRLLVDKASGSEVVFTIDDLRKYLNNTLSLVTTHIDLGEKNDFEQFNYLDEMIKLLNKDNIIGIALRYTDQYEEVIISTTVIQNVLRQAEENTYIYVCINKGTYIEYSENDIMTIYHAVLIVEDKKSN